MYFLRVPGQMTGIIESSPARPTLIRLFARVRKHVSPQVTRDGEAFITKITGVRPFPGMRSDVYNQSTGFLESHSTFVAHMTFIL